MTRKTLAHHFLPGKNDDGDESVFGSIVTTELSPTSPLLKTTNSFASLALLLMFDASECIFMYIFCQFFPLQQQKVSAVRRRHKRARRQGMR
ncbi:hypothetical protein niasHT_034640 [Heterodera trifolii]|uniref:Transmembrane protein n=1 Tax=Heterodera trifolii TaxID=157864 RepID=A0ABD2J0L7_9BILA